MKKLLNLFRAKRNNDTKDSDNESSKDQKNDQQNQQDGEPPGHRDRSRGPRDQQGPRSQNRQDNRSQRDRNRGPRNHDSGGERGPRRDRQDRDQNQRPRNERPQQRRDERPHRDDRPRRDDRQDHRAESAQSAPARPVQAAPKPRVIQAEGPALVNTLFSELPLDERILRAVAAEGYDHPTEIQAASIPIIAEGKDLIGCAQTGTGKTAAFALPILHRLSKQEGQRTGIKALVLSPTRELALQISESFETYGRHLNLKTVVVFGGVGQDPQRKALRARPDILVATPGRFLDLKNQGFIHLDKLEVFVLDEADRMLDMGFIHDVKKIINMLPSPRQNLLFSATMPDAIKDLSMKFLRDPEHVAVTPVSSTSERVEQFVYHVDKTHKRDLLLHVLEDKAVARAIVFTRTKSIANRVSEFLNKSDISAEAIHGNKSQSARQRALENFRSGKTRILVASDLAARGIDVDGITHVINYDVPNVAETYVHRIGRTGRARAVGTALSFCEHEEQPFIHGIERLTGSKIPVISDHPWPRSATPPPSEPRQYRGPARGPSRGGRPGGGNGGRNGGGGRGRQRR